MTTPPGLALWNRWFAWSSLMASKPTLKRPAASMTVVTQACAVGLNRPPVTEVFRLRDGRWVY